MKGRKEKESLWGFYSLLTTAACLTQADTSKSCMELYLRLTGIKPAIVSYFSCIYPQTCLCYSLATPAFELWKFHWKYWRKMLFILDYSFSLFVDIMCITLLKNHSLLEEQDSLKITCVVIRRVFAERYLKEREGAQAPV